MSRVRLSISGMSCEACVRALETALRAVAGVQSAHVEVGRAEVATDPSLVGLPELVRAVHSAGYELSGYEKLSAASPETA